MSLRSISFDVAGRPALLTANALVAEPWKTAVWRKSATAWKHGVIAEPCAVDLEFRIAARWYAVTAVANLLKATLDGLGRTLFAQVSSGQPRPWGTEDWWIRELRASKRSVDTQTGATIATGPCGRPPTEGPWSARVIGRPAPWVTREERAWRAAVSERVASALPPALPRRCGVRVDFVIDPGQMIHTDLDNLCVPASQAVHEALFGTFRQGVPNRFIALEASKREAIDEPLGVVVGLFEAD